MTATDDLEDFEDADLNDLDAAEVDPPEPVAQVNDALILGKIDPALFALPLTLAYGAHRMDREWINTTRTLGDLIKGGTLSKFARSGNKDSKAVLQGEVVASDAGKKGVARVAKNMRANHLLLVDYDTGSPIDEITASIKTRNWTCPGLVER